MIIWINGPFGGGKTTTARELVQILPSARLFDPEHVGFMLRHALVSEPVGDFQDWPPWRTLVVATARALLEFAGGTLVAPQSVLVQRYWREISSGLSSVGILVRHVVLDASRAEIIRRIEADEAEVSATQWRLDHLDAYDVARSWLSDAALVVDTTEARPAEVAARIACSVGEPLHPHRTRRRQH